MSVEDVGVKKPLISIIVPVLNEAQQLPTALASLQAYREGGAELIVVDGGSGDGSQLLLRGSVDTFIASGRGRATQMNAGATVARGEVLLFLHIDTSMPSDINPVLDRIAQCTNWGFFKLRLKPEKLAFKLISTLITCRSRVSGVATGDQALVVNRSLFVDCGGFAPIALMEDVELSKRLRRFARPEVFDEYVSTSARRWQKYGVVKTILLMWRLRFAFWLGVNANALASRYQ